MSTYSVRAFIKPGVGHARDRDAQLETMYAMKGERRGGQVLSGTAPVISAPDHLQYSVHVIHPQGCLATGDWYDLVSWAEYSPGDKMTGAWWIEVWADVPGEYELLAGNHPIHLQVVDVDPPQYPSFKMIFGTNPTHPAVSPAWKQWIESYGPEYVGKENWYKWSILHNQWLLDHRCNPYQPHAFQWLNRHNPSAFYDGYQNGKVTLPDPIAIEEVGKFSAGLWWNLINPHWGARKNQLRMGGKPYLEMTQQEIATYAKAQAKAFPQLVANLDEPGDTHVYPNKSQEQKDALANIEHIVKGFALGDNPMSLDMWDIDGHAAVLKKADILPHLGEVRANDSENKRRAITQEDHEYYADMGVSLERYLVSAGAVALDGRSIYHVPNAHVTAEDYIVRWWEMGVTTGLYWHITAIRHNTHWQGQNTWSDPRGGSLRMKRWRAAIGLYDLMHLAAQAVGRARVQHLLDESEGWTYEHIRGNLAQLVIPMDPPAKVPPPASPPDVAGLHLTHASTDDVVIHLQWDAVPGADEYVVWRNDQADGLGDWTAFRHVQENNFIDDTAIPDQTYVYRVDAHNRHGDTRMDPDVRGMAVAPRTDHTIPAPSTEAEVLEKLDDILAALELAAKELADLVKMMGD